MNKRISKKYLTDNERVILDLYHAAEKVEFCRFRELSDSAKRFTRILKAPNFQESNGHKWYLATKEIGNTTVEATAFIEPGEAE